MISSLKHHALTSRIIVPKNAASIARPGLNANHAKVTRSPRLSGRPLPRTLVVQVRLISSGTSPSPQQPNTLQLQNDIPLMSSSAKPRKVELRPGPLKATTSEQTSAREDLSPPVVQPKSGVIIEKEDSTAKASAVPESEGVIETAKHDYEVAADHGLLAPPPENASRLRKLFHQAKELFKFYVRGLKLIYTNRARVLQIQQRVKDGGLPLTRRESRFIRTYKQDLVKLIPFALTIIIAEELIPLMVLYAPFLLPSTCILPSQKDRIDNKRRDKQRAHLAEASDIFAAIRAHQQTNAATPTADSLLHGNTLVYLAGTLGLSTFGPPFRLRRSVKKHLAFIEEDDNLLRRESQSSSLTDTELRDATEERGLLTGSASPNEQRRQLNWWLDNTNVAKHESITRRIQLIAEAAERH